MSGIRVLRAASQLFGTAFCGVPCDLEPPDVRAGRAVFARCRLMKYASAVRWLGRSAQAPSRRRRSAGSGSGRDGVRRSDGLSVVHGGPFGPPWPAEWSGPAAVAAEPREETTGLLTMNSGTHHMVITVQNHEPR